MPENANLYALFESRFAEAGENTAFRQDDGVSLSYADLSRRVGRFANGLAALGVQPGDRVTAQIDKSIDNVCLYLATLKAGGVYHPLNTAYTPSELDFFVSDARPKIMVVASERLAALEPIAGRYGVSAIHTLGTDGTGTLADLIAGQADDHVTVERQADDLAGLLYTSGTTGRSKGAMITHGNLVSNAVTLHQLWGFVPGDVLLHALPIYHVHGLQVALHTAFLNKSEILWLEKFDAERILRLLPDASVMMGVPTFYTRLLASDAFNSNVCAAMRLFISGSAPLLAETHEEFAARTGHRILERYGMTETGMITSNPYDGDRIAGTVGFALTGVEARIGDDAGNEVPHGDVGVLEVRGPNVFKGYWQLPEKTAEEFRGDYFITGDLATQDRSGRVTIVGRAKDLIISGGFNVYPKEIEGHLDDLGGIGESAVVGVPHPDFGEAVIAVVTGGSNGAQPDEQQIIAGLSQHLARFKVPKRVFFTDALPRNTMGKVQKAELRKAYADTFK